MNIDSKDGSDTTAPSSGTQDLIDKQKTFFTRLCLSAPEDNEAADMKERVNLMSQAFGFSNLYECLDKLTETLDAARKKELDRS